MQVQTLTVSTIQIT